MALTLFTDAGNFRAFKALIAAEYNNVAIDIPSFKLGDNKTADFLKMSPKGSVPVLKTEGGAIFESNAIARYVANIRRDTELCGANLLASAQVDSWVDFCSHDMELPACVWVYPVLGYMAANDAAVSKAKQDLANALTILENYLKLRTYMVGEKITLADICLVSTLVYPFKFVADASFRKPFPNVMRWFNTCVNQPAFEAVVGSVVLCTAEMKAGGLPTPPAFNKKDKKAGGGEQKWSKENPKPKGEGGAKKEKAPKAPKPPAAPKEKVVKEEDDEDMGMPKPVKKVEHPFSIMDKATPTPFVMDAWKRCYSNAESYDAAMAEFWSTFDHEGWSLHRGDYQYNAEQEKLFMASNLVRGFLQRTEEIRKWFFGTHTIRGKEGKDGMKITAYYLIRGQEIQPLITCNDDANCYTWTKVSTPVSPEDKATIQEYWCSETTLQGEELLDSRVYK